MPNNERLKKDLEEVMLGKFIQANIYYVLSAISFTLLLVFLVQAAIYHAKQGTATALLFYFISILLFATGRICYSRGKALYKYF
mgnify:CR=1 FL=1